MLWNVVVMVKGEGYILNFDMLLYVECPFRPKLGFCLMYSIFKKLQLRPYLVGCNWIWYARRKILTFWWEFLILVQSFSKFVKLQPQIYFGTRNSHQISKYSSHIHFANVNPKYNCTQPHMAWIRVRGNLNPIY